MRKSETHRRDSPLTSDSVWSQIAASVANVRSIFADNKTVATGLRSFALRLYSSEAENLGWQYPKDEDILKGQLRALLVSAAGGAGHKR